MRNFKTNSISFNVTLFNVAYLVNVKGDNSFVEKLTAQIIKNVQIFIKNIHLRYEDRVTKPGHPFSVGVSLHTLELHTTNETCDRYVAPQQESPIFYKVTS